MPRHNALACPMCKQGAACPWRARQHATDAHRAHAHMRAMRGARFGALARTRRATVAHATATALALVACLVPLAYGTPAWPW